MSKSSIHTEVTQWLDRHWDPNMDLITWRSLVADSGWGAPSWPADYYGKDMTPQDAAIVEQAFAEFGANLPGHGDVLVHDVSP